MKPFIAEIDIDLNDTLAKNMECICHHSGGRLFPHHFTGWDAPMGELMNTTDAKAQQWAYENPELQLLALPHEGAKEALTMLRAAGVKINIVTASCMSESQIISWLEKWEIPFDEVIKTSAKIGQNLLIDDSLSTARHRYEARHQYEAGLPTLVFSQRWNKEAPGQRLDGWGSLVEIKTVKCFCLHPRSYVIISCNGVHETISLVDSDGLCPNCGVRYSFNSLIQRREAIVLGG